MHYYSTIYTVYSPSIQETLKSEGSLRKKEIINTNLPISLVLHSVINIIYFLCKHIKLRDDKFLPEGLDQ